MAQKPPHIQALQEEFLACRKLFTPWGTRPGRNCCVPCWQAPAREAERWNWRRKATSPSGGLPPPADSQGGGHCPARREGTYIYYYLNPQDGEIQRVLRLFQSIQQAMASAPDREGEA